jgi:hypothetical protein
LARTLLLSRSTVILDSFSNDRTFLQRPQQTGV